MRVVRVTPLGVVALVLLAACTPASAPSDAPVARSSERPAPPSSAPEPWRTDFERLAESVSLDQFVRALPERDAIAALVRPAVVPAATVDWIADDEPVIAVERGGEWRAYPLQVLLWHEIVNDELGGEPTVVTFCPLCHTAVVFDARLDGEPLEFGVTGYLRRSDLVMYDRATESWWQQATGVALVGEHAGRHLEILPSSLVAWSAFSDAHPESGVIDRSATGHDLPYGKNPYPGWDRVERNPFLGAAQLESCEGADGCLDPKERVGVVSVNGETVVFPFRELAAAGGLAERQIGGAPVVVWWQPSVRTVLDNALIERSDQVGTVVAFDRRVGGEVLSFELVGEVLTDTVDGSAWRPLGEPISGVGERLVRLQVDTPYWFGFAAFGAGYDVWWGEE